MGEDRRLVYSTEHGSLGKPTQEKGGKKGKGKPQPPAIKNPGKQGVRIRRDSKGRGGKTVCVIDGLELSAAGLKALLKRLKGQLGTGGAGKDGCIEIQGDHRDAVIPELEARGHAIRVEKQEQGAGLRIRHCN